MENATSEQQLLDDVWRIIIDVGGYHFAWAGCTNHDTESIRFMAHTSGHHRYRKKKLRKIDFHSRWGGEGFIIISAETTLEQMHQLTERVRNAIEGFQRFDNIHTTITSVSVSTRKTRAKSIFLSASMAHSTMLKIPGEIRPSAAPKLSFFPYHSRFIHFSPTSLLKAAIQESPNNFLLDDIPPTAFSRL